MKMEGEEGEEDEKAAAASAARRQVVQAAIDNDPLLSLKDSNECTPLHLAIINGARRGGAVGGGLAGVRFNSGGAAERQQQ